MKKRKGFTMVELMVVIIIMAILGLAVVPSLVGSSEKAKYSTAWSDLTTISNAFTAFYGRVGNLPQIKNGDLKSGIFTAGKGPEFTGINCEDLFQSFLGKPLAQIKDPWGAAYQVSSSWDPAKGSGYIVVYVTGGTTTGGTTADATFGTGISVTARTDPYNGNQPMAKLVINVM